MRRPETPPALIEILRAVAAERRLELAHDTHYDAFDWELRWWVGPQLHRLNFQPWLGDKVLIFHNVDAYPTLPRLLRWAHRSIPFFPHVARTTSQSCGEFGPETSKELYASRVRDLLGHAA